MLYAASQHDCWMSADSLLPQHGDSCFKWLSTWQPDTNAARYPEIREYAPLWNPVWVDKEPNGNFDWTSQRGCGPSADTEVPARVQRQRVLNESWVVSYDWQGLGAPLPLLPWSHWWLNGVNRRDRVLTPLSGQNLRPITFSVCSNCKSCVDSVGGWGKKKAK